MMSPLGLRTLDIVTEDRQIDPLTAERLKRRSFGLMGLLRLALSLTRRHD